MDNTRCKIVAALTLIAIVYGLILAEVCIDNYKWNGGYCDRCGEKWKFTNGSIENQRKIYWYACEDCENVIYTSCAME